jgi:hypothetical protein
MGWVAGFGTLQRGGRQQRRALFSIPDDPIHRLLFKQLDLLGHCEPVLGGLLIKHARRRVGSGRRFGTLSGSRFHLV